MARHNKSRKSRQGLKAAFMSALGSGVAAVALLSGHGIAGAAPDADLPNLVNIFGQSAQRAPQYADPIQEGWNNMLDREHHTLLYEPDKAEAYKRFLDQFNGFTGEPIAQMAADVNRIVYSEIATTGGTAYNTPIDTVLSGKGAPQDFATLEEDIMRYLGVSDNQMLVARLNSQNNACAGADFTALLVNNGSATAPQFLIMSNFPDVIPADNSVVERSWTVRPGMTTRFALVDARNAEGEYRKPASLSMG